MVREREMWGRGGRVGDSFKEEVRKSVFLREICFFF